MNDAGRIFTSVMGIYFFLLQKKTCYTFRPCILKGTNSYGSLEYWRLKMACRDILRALFSHWLHPSLINERAKQHNMLSSAFEFRLSREANIKQN